MPRTPVSAAQPDIEKCDELVPSESYLGPALGRLVGTPADLFSSDKKRYASRFSVVKLNWTFHDKRQNTAEYRACASELRALGLSAVVKVSQVATHKSCLRDAEHWWPHLWSLYTEFLNLGVLAALVWQCPPSFRCTDEALHGLEALCSLLAESGARHVFEFRHASWYERPEVSAVLQRFGCCLAWLHIREPSSALWAKDNGWTPKLQTAYFVYIQLHGTEGRALGRYSADVLHGVANMLPASAIVLFCQVDVPQHAWSNAEGLCVLLAAKRAAPDEEIAHDSGTEPRSTPGSVDGKVLHVTRLTANLDIGGQLGVLGLNHLRGRGGHLSVGDAIHGLRIEAIGDDGVLRLSLPPEGRVIPGTCLEDGVTEVATCHTSAVETHRWSRRWRNSDVLDLRGAALEGQVTGVSEDGVSVDIGLDAVTGVIQRADMSSNLPRVGDQVSVGVASVNSARQQVALVPNDPSVRRERFGPLSEGPPNEASSGRAARGGTASFPASWAAREKFPALERKGGSSRPSRRSTQAASAESPDPVPEDDDASRDSEGHTSSDDSADRRGSLGYQSGEGYLQRLPAPTTLGANAEREIAIQTWGTARMQRPPEAQVHITCDIKKFHYLTRNNKFLKRLTGLDDEVQEQICRCGFFSDWIASTVTRIEREHVSSLALNCFKGTHRSVAAAEILRKVYYPRATVRHLTMGYIRPGRAGGPSRT